MLMVLRVLRVQAESAELHSQLAQAQGQLQVTPDRCRSTHQLLQEEARKWVQSHACDRV